MLMLLIRRRSIPIPRTLSSSLHSLSFDSDDDPPFSPVSVKSSNPKFDGNNKKKQADTSISSNSEPAQISPQRSDLPFDFRYSYTETNSAVHPIGFREPPRFSPYGPGRIDRKWIGTCAPAEEDDQGVKTRRWVERRDRVLGYPLSQEEVAELVEMYRHNDCNRQINIVYPKLVKNMADGLTFEETKELRNRGLNALALITRNGVYVHVVQRVRDAFEEEEVVRLDCSHVGTSNCKRIGVNLRDLVPCVPILFKDEQIILWRGKGDQEWVSSSSNERVE